MGWTNNTTDTLTIPPDAGPDDPQIVIGGDLPPPLDTYEPAGPGTSYKSGIVFYPEGTNGSHGSYLCMVEDPNVPSWVRVDMGEVDAGMVLEFSAGQPMVQRWAQKIGLDQKTFWTNLFAVHAKNGITLETSLIGTTISLSVPAGSDVLVTADNLAVTGGLSATNGAGITGTVNVTGLATASAGLEVAGDRVAVRSALRSQATGAAGSRNVNTFADLPGAHTVSINKLYAAADSKLRVRYAPTFFVNAADTGAEFAVSTGGVDYVTHGLHATITAGVHLPTFGERYITGLAAGNHTLTARWRRAEGTGSIQVDAATDWVVLAVEEVAV